MTEQATQETGNDSAVAPSLLNVELGLLDQLREEADLCRNETADDIAVLLDKAADEIERLRGYFEADTLCPCCEQWDECEDGCTFAEDAPYDYEKMIYARGILSPNVQGEALPIEKGKTKL